MVCEGDVGRAAVWLAPTLAVGVGCEATIPFEGGGKRNLKCSIALHFDPETITGWYDGSDSRWSTDNKRQKLFAKKSDARPVCDELRILCPRNAEVINIQAVQDDPSLDLVLR